MTSVRHDRHRHGFTVDLGVLGLPEAQPIIRRIGENVDPTYPYRMEHIVRVATIALNAKRRPNNAFARATL